VRRLCGWDQDNLIVTFCPSYCLRAEEVPVMNWIKAPAKAESGHRVHLSRLEIIPAGTVGEHRNCMQRN
jgi:hypothetical protein